MTEMDEKEPKLDQMSDYKKPLSKKKLQVIIFAFVIAIAAYYAYALLMAVL